jgi:Na+-translocating ferredoxin:NAD+ oxidoreductase subunit C
MSRSLTFKGGIHPEYCKERSICEPLREAPLPKTVILPLSQHIGAPNIPVVKKGDVVEEGDVVGKSDSFISSPVHSPVSGKVLDIKKAFHPALGPIMSVFIERDETKPPRSYEIKNKLEDLSSGEIIEKVRSAGTVGMGGAAFPTHVKLSVPAGKKIDTLIINGAECEPYLTCDQVLMEKKTKEILLGVFIAKRILSPDRIFISVEDNKKADVLAFQKALKELGGDILPGISVVTLKTKYPQGGEKQLIKAITGREVPPGKLPLDVGCMVQNVGTMNAIYEAVIMEKPLIERIVTVSGDCVSRCGNYVARVGTTIKDLVELCGIEFRKDPYKIIVGGPMMGVSQTGMDSPILKNTSGILFLSDKVAGTYGEQNCIRCAKCVDVCPMMLAPTDIMRNVKKEKWDKAKELNISDCMECGSCSYVCPARIPLVQYIKEGKTVLSRMKRE